MNQGFSQSHSQRTNLRNLNEVPGARIGCWWSGRRCNPTGKSQEQWGRESLSDLVSTQLNTGVLFHYQKSWLFQRYIGYLYKEQPSLLGVNGPLSFWSYAMWKATTSWNPEQPRVTIGSCAVFTNLVITLYWEVQWACGFLHWKVNFKMVPWSTHAPLELWVFKSYDQLIMKVRTCPNWLS
jgi:hypothetical protein